MSFKLDMSKFKKLHTDKHHTTLKHDDGHEIKIAHSALSHKYRKQLESLPSVQMNSGAASQSMPMAEGGKISIAGGVRAAEGGKLEVEKLEHPLPKHPVDYEEIKPLEIEKLKKSEPKQHVEYEKLADGGEVAEDSQQSDKSFQQMPTTAGQPIIINNMPPQAATSAPEQPSLADAQAKLAKMPEAQSPQPTPAQPGQSAPQPSAMPQGATPPTASPDKQPEQPSTPDAMHAYSEQSKGIAGEAQAEQNKADEQAQAFQTQAREAGKMMSSYQEHLHSLDQERKALQEDIMSQHIDPNKYMGSLSSADKFMTSVALILGGYGGAGTGKNQALDVLNSQIDRDIDAQKAELGKKETLLSANLRQYGNLKDATEMTKVMMGDIVQSKLSMAAAKAANPLAKARAQQMQGQLEAQFAPAMNQMAMRKALEGAGQQPGELIKTDPTTFVSSMVPADKQKEVAKEIDEAKEIVQNKDKLLRNFHEAAKENTILKTGAGYLREPGAVKELKSLILPQFKNIDGTVREYAAEQAFHNFIPAPGDSQPTIDHKLRALQDWMVSKQGGALSKVYGIDLNKFAATSTQQSDKVETKTFGGATYQKVAGGWKKVK